MNMIQTASLGVGVMGKEGNQAAKFSEFAIPNFQSLNRLVFWHGLAFGHKFIIYIIPMNLFKGAIFVTGVLIANFYNGFSGMALFKDFYFSLYPVSMTPITVTGFLLINKAFSFNP